MEVRETTKSGLPIFSSPHIRDQKPSDKAQQVFQQRGVPSYTKQTEASFGKCQVPRSTNQNAGSGLKTPSQVIGKRNRQKPVLQQRPTTPESKEEPPRGEFAVNFEMSEELWQSLKAGNNGHHVLRMKASELKGKRYTGHMEQMELPNLNEPEVSIASTPLFSGEVFDLFQLKQLFPSPLKQPCRQFQFDPNTIIDIVPVSVTKDQIENLKLTQEEIGMIRRLNFFSCGLTDEQLIAIANKFPFLEEVNISLCPEISNHGVAVLRDLEQLKKVTLRCCPKVDAFEKIPLEQLEEFSLATDAQIPGDILKRLAQSEVLRLVDFSLCTNLTPEVLLMLKGAKGSVVLILKGCNQIDANDILELNQGREIPFEVIFGPPNLQDQELWGIPREVEPPPQIPDQDDIFSMSIIQKIFPNSKQTYVPDHSLVSDLPGLAGIETFQGIDLSGELKNETLIALVDQFPKMRVVRLYDCPLISYSGLVPLRRLTSVHTLYLGKLPGITSKMLEIMLSDMPDSPSWIQLKSVHLAGLPVTDLALTLLSRLRNLEEINISNCDRFTVCGFRALMEDCPALKKLTVFDCRSLDVLSLMEFIEERPGVELIMDKYHDPSALQIAIEEANQRWAGNDFLSPAFGELTQEMIQEIFECFGREAEFSEEEDSGNMYFDQVLQSYMNISRIAWAIRNQLIEVGFFTNQEPESPPPRNLSDILRMLQVRNQKQSNQYVRKVQQFDFTDLGVTFFPRFIADKIWPQVRVIKLKGCPIEEIPKMMKNALPSLEKIEYTDYHIEFIPRPKAEKRPPPEREKEVLDPPTIEPAENEKSGGFARWFKSLFNKKKVRFSND